MTAVLLCHWAGGDSAVVQMYLLSRHAVMYSVPPYFTPHSPNASSSNTESCTKMKDRMQLLKDKKSVVFDTVYHCVIFFITPICSSIFSPHI